jgi:F-box/leucine-rich repeat protein 2/20
MMGLALTSNTFLGGVCGRARTLNFVESFGYDVSDGFGANQVTALLRRCDGLRYVSMRGDRPLVDDQLVVALMAYCTSLRSLTLTSGSLTDSAVAAMVRVHAGLVELNFACQHKLTDVAPCAIAKHLPKLELLNLSYAGAGRRRAGDNEISDDGVIALAQKCTALKTLRLSGIPVTDAALLAVAEHCPELRVLSVGDCDHISDAGVIALVQRCAALKSLDLENTRVTDDVVSAVAKNCPYLEELDLCAQDGDFEIRRDVTDNALRTIAKYLPKLQALRLEDRERISDAGVIELVRSCTALKTLNVCDTLVTDAAVVAIAKHCPIIEDLNLQMTNYDSSRNGTVLTDESVVALGQNCPRLRNLNLKWSAVTHVGLEALGIGCSLEDLSLDHCKHVSDDGVAALVAGLSTKSSLSLSLDGTPITKVSVLTIAARFPKLLSLDVRAAECDVGDEDVLTLAKCCPDLRRLSYRNQGQMSQATRDALKASNPNLRIW